MERRASIFIWFLVSGLLSQNLVVPVLSSTLADQKSYYSPDPHSGGSPGGSPGGSHGTPSHGTPSHHTPSHHTPSHTPTPSRGSRRNCSPTPSRDPPPTSGGSTPSTPVYTTPPSTPTPTPRGGGAYYPPPTSGGSTPSTPVYTTPPSTPVYTTPPSTPVYTPPSTPVYTTPPTTPIIDPGTPPSTPLLPDPNSPFTCIYWLTHPALIWGVVGWRGTVAGLFGVGGYAGFSGTTSLTQALSNTRTDGYGQLYREGTASYLNSLSTRRFPFTTNQVRDSFIAALSSNKAASDQARTFRMANEGRLKH